MADLGAPSVLVVTLGIVLLVSSCAGGDPPPMTNGAPATQTPAPAPTAAGSGAAAGTPAGAERAAIRAGERFLDRYMEPDGRVTRPDQGGDTVSEGQAYAMLVAVALDDRERFDLAWSWARDNLQRDDGLFAFHWAGGQVVDRSAASDADLDIATALVLAADRFDGSYREEGLRIAVAILDHETVEVDGGRVLIAGPWAQAAPHVVNPSYFSPLGYEVLEPEDGRWEQVRDSSYRVVDDLTRDGLPPDWAHVRADGEVVPIGTPSQPQAEPRYSFDAVRVPLRMGADCAPRGRQLAGRLWPMLRERRDDLVTTYGLGGDPAGDDPHAAALVGAAGAAAGAGDVGAVQRLLAAAESRDANHPSYYGSALVALGRLLLTTELTGC